jgi:cell division protein FtsI/penicillin-binding protein 2
LAGPAWALLLVTSRSVAGDQAPAPPAQGAREQRVDGARVPRVSLAGLSRRGDAYLAPLEGGGEAILTLQAPLQKAAEEVLASYAVPFGAAVVLSVPDGRVLALAGRSSVEPSLGPAELALRPWAPAASVFKIVSAAALVAEAKLSPETRVCYHGGVSSILADNLLDVPRLDTRCETLGYGVGKSQNAILAKLAARHLSRDGLARAAAAFGFGEPIAFEAAAAPSDLWLPVRPLEFARAAAGFWHSSLSVLHGALLAAAIANDGEMPTPRLVEKAVDGAGHPLPPPRARPRRAVAPEVAREVGRMMVLTTTMGTARTTFRDRRGQRVLPFDVAGKTGSLAYRGQEGDPALPAPWPADTYLGYSWFVGYAPADHPRLAFAVLIANKELWHIKAPFVARRLLAEHLAAGAEARVASVVPAR